MLLGHYEVGGFMFTSRRTLRAFFPGAIVAAATQKTCHVSARPAVVAQGAEVIPNVSASAESRDLQSRTDHRADEDGQGYQSPGRIAGRGERDVTKRAPIAGRPQRRRVV